MHYIYLYIYSYIYTIYIIHIYIYISVIIYVIMKYPMFLVKYVNLITIITVYQKLIYYHPLFRQIQLLIIYSRFLHQLIFLFFCTQCLPHVLNNEYVSPQYTGIKSISDNLNDLNIIYASLNTYMNDLIILSKEQKSINVASSKRTYADLFDGTSIKQHSTLLAKSISK